MLRIGTAILMSGLAQSPLILALHPTQPVSLPHPPATIKLMAQRSPDLPPLLKGRLQMQAREYEVILQNFPEDRAALRGLSLVLLQLGDENGAIAPLEKLVQLNPSETYYALLLADTQEKIGDRQGAVLGYRRILDTQPGHLVALQRLVSLLVSGDRPEIAIELLKDTLKNARAANQIQSNRIDVLAVQMILGQVYAQQKRYEEAIAVYEHAIAGNPADFRPVFGKALVFKTLGRTREAQILFKTAIDLAPDQYKQQIEQEAI